MNALDEKLNQILKDFVINAEKEYKTFMDGLNKSLNPAVGTPEQRRIESVKFARSQGVPEDRIMKSPEELRYWLGEGWKQNDSQKFKKRTHTRHVCPSV